MTPLTKEELEVSMECLFRRASMLEASGLKDSYCYPLLMSAYHKLKEEKDERFLNNGD